MPERDQVARFEQEVLPHLGAAYNLARWLTRNEHDAEDLVQEAYLRALRFFEGFRGGDSRAWLLIIVRNACYTWLGQQGKHEAAEFDEEIHSPASPDPETLLLDGVEHRAIQGALEELPTEFREVIVLRELEGLSYKEIADVAGLPVGTVMSRLARARQRLAQSLAGLKRKEP